jgi:hypothetical protein
MSASSAMNYDINTLKRFSPAGWLTQFQAGNNPAS